MATGSVLPLLIGFAVLASIGACRRPGSQRAPVAPRSPTLQTRLLDTRAWDDSPPKTAPTLQVVHLRDPQARREGGIPESITIADDCSVRVIWWATHLCGVNLKGAATWDEGSRMGFATVTAEGTGRTTCPSVVTRFETVIQGLPNGGYRFGTARKYVDFDIGCAKLR
jgi:hypothetical protein